MMVMSVHGCAASLSEGAGGSEVLLKTAEMLALKGDMQGERDQIIAELMVVQRVWACDADQ